MSFLPNMKDKIKPFDVSLMSTYMGRSLTIVVALFVIGTAVSALLNGGGATRNIIHVCVPSGGTGSMTRYEPFRVLLGRQARRPVVLSSCQSVWPRGQDVYVMPVRDYFLYGGELGITALFSIRPSARKHDTAVLVARAASPEPDLARLDPSEIVFTHPSSVNGFWIPLADLEKRGFRVPVPARLQFAGSARNASRIALGVLYGVYRVGACTLTDLAGLSDDGVVRPGELGVIARYEGLPEVLVAARSTEAEYYRRRLGGVAAMLENDVSTVTRDGTVALLKSLGVKGLDPVSGAELARCRSLFDSYGRLFDPRPESGLDSIRFRK